jgi:hypothetical protein
VAETPDRTVAWLDSGGAASGPVSVEARFYPDRAEVRSVPTAGALGTLSAPDLGSVDPAGGLDGAGNRVGDAAYVFVQSAPDGRRLVAAFYDRAPGALSGYTTQSWRKFARPPVRWSPSQDLNGGVTYQVLVDNVAVGQTRETTLTPLNPIPDGEHQWRVVATDRFGQSVSSRSRLLRVDSVAPTLSFRVKRKGAVATVTALTTDPIPPGKRASGVKIVKIDFGDGSPLVTGREATHRFGRKGAFMVRVSSTDRAGNAVAVTRRVRVK